MTIQWISVEERLPEDGQAVLAFVTKDNWHQSHSLDNGQLREKWKYAAARFVRGKTSEEWAVTGIHERFDQSGNNEKPYGWDEFGAGFIFGQEVSHWAAISEPSA